MNIYKTIGKVFWIRMQLKVGGPSRVCFGFSEYLRLPKNGPSMSKLLCLSGLSECYAAILFKPQWENWKQHCIGSDVFQRRCKNACGRKYSLFIVYFSPLLSYIPNTLTSKAFSAIESYEKAENASVDLFETVI